MAVGSVDRVEEIPERVAVIFDWDAGRAADLVRAEPDGTRVIEAFRVAIADHAALDRDTFRAAAGRVKDATGVKGRALFHPIRVALTAAESGPELDLAIPAIERGAAMGPGAGIKPVTSCLERVTAVLARLRA
jgi:glutamyl/glutaminyl-tRNA synthetase